MALTFLTQPQHMTFVDHATLMITPAHELLSWHTYDVFLVIQNDDGLEHLGVQVSVSHTAFGIGLPGGQTQLTEPLPVTVPPKLGELNGQATVEFQYHTPPGGHMCLGAVIVGTHEFCSQNTDIRSVPAGTDATLSFLVFGDAAQPEMMRLNVTERGQGGAVAPSWHPRLVAPAGTGPAAPSPGSVTLNLPAHSWFSAGLLVSIPAGASGAHVFHIAGTVNGRDVGSVDITVEASPVAIPAPHPYVIGGIHTPDIILIDPLTSLPVVNPAGDDSELQPNTNYGFQARIHNDSPTDATNTVVRFWQFPGGCAATGTLLDVQTATIPAMGSVIVTSNAPFPSAPAGEHRCAVVSIYNSQSSCTVDAVTATMVPNPGMLPVPSCSAWRNTDSMVVHLGFPWQIFLVAAVAEQPPGPGPGPVEISVEALAVPRDFAQLPELKLVRDSLLAAGAPVARLHKLDSLRSMLKPADLGVAVTPGKPDGAVQGQRAVAGTTAVAAPRATTLDVTKGPAPFTVTGTLPNDAKAGDVFLVHVKATYPPQRGGDGPRVISFSQELTVGNKA